jgi:hypothetical protein
VRLGDVRGLLGLDAQRDGGGRVGGERGEDAVEERAGIAPGRPEVGDGLRAVEVKGGGERGRRRREGGSGGPSGAARAPWARP